MVKSNLLNALSRSKRTRTTTKSTATAATPVVEDRTLQTWIKSVETALSQKGVSTSDLIDYGILGFDGNGNLQALFPKTETDLTVPLTVTNLTANGAYSSVVLDWNTPNNKSFGYNAIYRSETNDFGTAAQIGSTIGNVYTDYIGNGIKAYYWVRTISKYGVEGHLSPSVYAETSINIPYLLEQLKDKITNSQFTQSLRTEIANISVDLQNIINTTANDLALSISNLQSEVTNNASQNSAAISNVQNTLNTKIENVAQEISLVTAGVGEQFDTLKIWFFDENTTEGWTSTGGVPTVIDGWIKPFINGADTTLISPPDLPFSGTAYSDIRFRVKKIGNPQWNASILWGENYSLYMSIPEPIWNEENGIGSVQKNIGWIGTIGQIKLKLSTTQDANNYFIVDWFSFGRPSPAASWSAIGEVKTAIANETYARTQYQNSNEAKWASNDTVYRGLIQDAKDIAANENGITASRLDNFIVETTPIYAGSEDDFAGSDEVYVGHITEETLRIEGDQAVIKQVDALAVKVNDEISAAIQEEKQIRTSENQAMAQTISNVQTTVGQNTAAIQETKTSIDGINAEWKLQVKSGNKLSGISIGNNGTESAFTILTDRFSLVQEDGEALLTPFTLDADGKIYMNSVAIKEGSISQAKIGNLSADKITSGDIAADRMKANIVQAIEGKFTSLSAITARIGTLRTATSGARVEISDNLIQVFDEYGRTRIRIGVF